MKLFNIEGKELGNYINEFKKSFANTQDYEDWILATNDTVLILERFAHINNLKVVKI